MVDQASGDGTAAWLAAARPDVQVVALDRNIGFGAGNNRGAPVARGRWLLLLNSDAFVDPGAIDELVRFGDERPAARGRRPAPAQRRRRACSAPAAASRASGGSPPSTCSCASSRRSSRLLNAFYCGGFAHDAAASRRLADGGRAAGAARAAFEAAGGFDEAFFMYSEEVDLALRARLADRGAAETWFEPRRRASTHLWGGTTRRAAQPASAAGLLARRSAAAEPSVPAQPRTALRHDARRPGEAARRAPGSVLLARAPRRCAQPLPACGPPLRGPADVTGSG